MDAPKILVINGSGRTNGNGTRTLDALGEAILRQRPDSVLTPLSLAGLDIKPCLGCRRCFDRGEERCPRRDRLRELEEAILAHDLVIMASPVYVGDVSGIVKTAIDRLAYVCHRPRFFRQGVFLLATTGSSPTRHAIRTMQGAWLSWGARLVGSAGFAEGAITDREEIDRRYGRAIERAARRIVQFRDRRPVDRPSFLALMMFRIQQWNWGQADPESIDYRYWSERGWLDNGARYFTSVSLSPLRAASARLVGSLIARLVSV